MNWPEGQSIAEIGPCECGHSRLHHRDEGCTELDPCPCTAVYKPTDYLPSFDCPNGCGGRIHVPKIKTLQARLDRVAALRVKWENDWITSGSVPAAGAIRNCTFELLKALSDEGMTP